MPVAAASPDNEPDWSGIRAASVTVGVREAARQAAKDLPPDEQDRFVERVMKRCSREGWLIQAQAVRTAPRTQQQAKPLSAPVRNGADSITSTLAERHSKTKLGLSAWAVTSAEHLAQLKGEEALAAHQAAVGTATVAAKVWPEQAPASVRISMFAHGQQLDVETVADGPVIDV